MLKTEFMFSFLVVRLFQLPLFNLQRAFYTFCLQQCKQESKHIVERNCLVGERLTEVSAYMFMPQRQRLTLQRQVMLKTKKKKKEISGESYPTLFSERNSL